MDIGLSLAFDLRVAVGGAIREGPNVSLRNDKKIVVACAGPYDRAKHEFIPERRIEHGLEGTRGQDRTCGRTGHEHAADVRDDAGGRIRC